jgi:hypothetical protein
LIHEDLGTRGVLNRLDRCACVDITHEHRENLTWPFGCDLGIQLEILLARVANKKETREGKAVENVEDAGAFSGGGGGKDAVEERAAGI